MCPEYTQMDRRTDRCKAMHKSPPCMGTGGLNETNMINWMPFTCMLSMDVRYSSNCKNYPRIDKVIIWWSSKGIALGKLEMNGYALCILKLSLTLVKVPKNNHIKGILRSILTQTRVMGSFLTPADAFTSNPRI